MPARQETTSRCCRRARATSSPARPGSASPEAGSGPPPSGSARCSPCRGSGWCAGPSTPPTCRRCRAAPTSPARSRWSPRGPSRRRPRDDDPAAGRGRDGGRSRRPLRPQLSRGAVGAEPPPLPRPRAPEPAHRDRPPARRHRDQPRGHHHRAVPRRDTPRARVRRRVPAPAPAQRPDDQHHHRAVVRAHRGRPPCRGRPRRDRGRPQALPGRRCPAAGDPGGGRAPGRRRPRRAPVHRAPGAPRGDPERPDVAPPREPRRGLVHAGRRRDGRLAGGIGGHGPRRPVRTRLGRRVLVGTDRALVAPHRPVPVVPLSVAGAEPPRRPVRSGARRGDPGPVAEPRRRRTPGGARRGSAWRPRPSAPPPWSGC